MINEDTIVAPATAAGGGGVGIIRVSGPDAERQFLELFRPTFQPEQFKTHHFYYGHFCRPDGEILDEVMAVIMRGPRSFTTEDTVEFHCHNSIVILRQILNIIINNGVRMADPGEFTKRAFLNGRVDLCQAEAVADLIAAKSEKAGKVALQQLSGRLSASIKEYRKKLLHILALVETHIDFSEEDIELPDVVGLANDVRKVKDDISVLVQTYATGRLLQEGTHILILGAPNVGKSSLLNRLVGSDRAIVTDIPGTTRDSLEEQHQIGGFPIKLIDTAGIRKTDDPIETEGIKRAYDRIEKADLVLLMVEAGSEIKETDRRLLDLCQNSEVIWVVNKVDRVRNGKGDDLLPGMDSVEISCKTGQGIEALEVMIKQHLESGREGAEESFVLYNARHCASLQGTIDALGLFLEGIEQGLSPDLLAIELRQAIQYVGEVTGESVTEEMLDVIFSHFCIGK